MPEDNNTSRKLIMRLGHMGDVILVSGIARYFGERWKCTFDILTREQWAPLFLHHPYVARVIPARKTELQGTALIRYLKKVANAYSAKDTLYDLHGVLRSRLLAALWPGEVRRYRKLSLERRLFMMSGGRIGTHRLKGSSVPQRYATAFYDEENYQSSHGLIPEQELLPCLYLAAEEKDWASEHIAKAFPGANPTSPLVAIHPFATHLNKTWPEEIWKKLTAQLEAKGISWIVIGAAPEEQAKAWVGGNSFVNRTTLRETMALLAHADVLVTGDSGPLHLARGVKTKVVALFGPTIQEWGFFPTPDEGVVLETDKTCRPCSLHGAKPCPHNGICLRDISPDLVAETVRHLLPQSC